MFCCAAPDPPTVEEELIPDAGLTQEDIKAIRAQCNTGGGPRLLVLDRQVDPSGVLLDAILPNVLCVSYDSDEDTTTN
jgi:hypothetical protein